MSIDEEAFSAENVALWRRKAAALDWLEAYECEIARLGHGSGLIFLDPGESLLDAIETRKAEADK